METAIETLRNCAKRAREQAAQDEMYRADRQQKADKSAAERDSQIAKAEEYDRAIAMMEAAQHAAERVRQSAQEPSLPTEAWKSEGWIEWAGGVNPVGDKKVQYRLRDGYTGTFDADMLGWNHVGRANPGSEIIAYKVVEEPVTGMEMINGPDGRAYIAYTASKRLVGQPVETKGKMIEFITMYADSSRINGPLRGRADPCAWGTDSAIVGYIILEEERPEPAKQVLPEGFKPWTGKKLMNMCNVEVLMRGGAKHSGRSSSFRWNHDGTPDDIIGYRVL